MLIIILRSMLIASLLAASSTSYGAGGYFSVETCEGARAFAKRVFLTKQMGMSYSKYVETEGKPSPGPAGEMTTKIERGIFTNPRISSESLAAEYGYSVCITWSK